MPPPPPHPIPPSRAREFEDKVLHLRSLTGSAGKGAGIHPFVREVAQAGSAPGLGPGGRRFESCLPDLSLKLRQDVKPVNAEFAGFCFKYTLFCCKFFQLEGDHSGDLPLPRQLLVAERRIGRYLLGRRRGSGGSTCCRVCYRRSRSPS
jgi:hypothetical protein